MPLPERKTEILDKIKMPFSNCIYNLLDALSENLPSKRVKVRGNCGSIGKQVTRFEKKVSVKFPGDQT